MTQVRGSIIILGMMSPAPRPEQIVTSSDLVRHFGLWQERAARAPLYILHRGRPRFVLTSIETMDALCATHTPPLLAATGLACVTINPRGYAVDPSATLAAMTGLTRDALTMIRFVALAEIGARVALGAAIEQAMAGKTPAPLHVGLLVNRADPATVRIGLAPLRIGTAITGVTAVLVAS